MIDQLPSSPERMQTCRNERKRAADSQSRWGKATRRYQRELDALTAIGADPAIIDQGIGPIIETTCGRAPGAPGAPWVTALISNHGDNFVLAADGEQPGHWGVYVQADPDSSGGRWVEGQGDDLIATYQRTVWEWHRRFVAGSLPPTAGAGWELTIMDGPRIDVTRYDGQSDAHDALLDYVARRTGHSTPAVREDTDHHPQILDYFAAHPDESFYLI